MEGTAVFPVAPDFQDRTSRTGLPGTGHPGLNLRRRSDSRSRAFESRAACRRGCGVRLRCGRGWLSSSSSQRPRPPPRHRHHDRSSRPQQRIEFHAGVLAVPGGGRRGGLRDQLAAGEAGSRPGLRGRRVPGHRLHQYLGQHVHAVRLSRRLPGLRPAVHPDRPGRQADRQRHAGQAGHAGPRRDRQRPAADRGRAELPERQLRPDQGDGPEDLPAQPDRPRLPAQHLQRLRQARPDHVHRRRPGSGSSSYPPRHGIRH